MKLSVIIPVYNVEGYISRCVASVLKQKSNIQYEIIIIDDGSTDNSLSITNSISRKFSNIHVFSHPNKGLSAVRNEGILHAKGEYLWFVDSDDYLIDGSLSVIEKYLHNEYDIIAINANLIVSDKVNTIYRKSLKEGECKSVTLYNKGYIYPYSGAQFYIYRKRFLIDNNLYFKEGIFYEDMLFTPMAIFLSDKCFYLKRPVYAYVIRKGSITQSSVTYKKCSDILTVADELYRFLNICNNEDYLKKRILYNSISIIYSVYFSQFINKLNDDDRKIAIEDFYKRKYWTKVVLLSLRFNSICKLLYRLFINR